jgi:hypothetical protein
MRRAFGTAVAAVACCLAGGAVAGDLQGWRPAGLHGPYADEVRSRPSDAELLAVWPATAAARKLPGDAIAACKANLAGELSDCRIMVQRPAKAGFGDALLSLAPKYRLQPAAAGVRPPLADVLISASWPIPDVAPDWLVEPKPGDFATSGNKAFQHRDGPASAYMHCLLGKLGTFYQCVVVYQDPPGIGLGQMLLRFATYLKFKPAMLNGKPLPVGVTFGFNFYKAKSIDAPHREGTDGP